MLSDFRLWVCNFIIGYIPFHLIRLSYYKYIMGFRIGKGSSIHLGTKFNCSKNLIIGNNCTINQYCRLDNRGGIFIKDNVSISPYVKIITADHDINTKSLDGRNKNVFIEDYSFLGADCLVLGGVNIAKGTVIGARALVIKSTEDFGIYYGVPATIKGKRDRNTIDYNASYKRWFL